MNTIEAPKITAASLWASIKKRAKIRRSPFPSGWSSYDGDVVACSCYISDKQAAYLRSLCQKEGLEAPSSQDKFALESGIGLLMEPSKYGYSCSWHEFIPATNNERKS